jgi:membrane protease YdiL (CAAX protease family)
MSSACSYCGIENADDAEKCVACGSSLSTTIQPPPAEFPPILAAPPLIVADAIPPKPPLNGWSATLIFLAYFLAQTIVGFIAGFVGVILVMAKNPGAKAKELLPGMMQEIVAFAALPTMVFSGLAMFFLALYKIRAQLRDGSPTGAAWLVGTFRQNFLGLCMGIVTAICYFLLSALFPPAEDLAHGPISQMALKPGAQQIIWITVALLFAPLIEECLFRGILYGGYRRAMGPTGAALLTTFIFWALHLTETARFWPAMVGIAALALVALWSRLTFSAIGPAVSVHVGYNGMMVLAALISTFASH